MIIHVPGDGLTVDAALDRLIARSCAGCDLRELCDESDCAKIDPMTVVDEIEAAEAAKE